MRIVSSAFGIGALSVFLVSPSYADIDGDGVEKDFPGGHYTVAQHRYWGVALLADER